MKGFVVVSRFWTLLFSAGRATAVTIFPFIFVVSEALKKDSTLVRHERIHIRQALELGVLPFYLWYLLEFVFYYLRCWDFQKAYLQISFEREAYAQQANANYLKDRTYWAFLNYCGKAIKK